MKNLKYLLLISILLVQCKTPYENESKIIFKINRNKNKIKMINSNNLNHFN